MGTTRLPIRMFLWALSAIYMCAFASLYIQIPGLYGNDGILPARWMLRFSGEDMWERWRTLPTLLWLAPRLGLDTQQGMELLCLTGALLSMAATALPVLRDCRVFLMLWVMYLSLYQVGQVFLYFQWDNLLLEVGFLAVLIAPMNMPWARGYHPHDKVTFWLLRWLLFRLMFASGVVKLTSRCPTWWGLTALTYHYETQCLPTPLAWWAHQLPVWFQKLSVVGTFVIEVAAPFLFLSPIRRHRLTAAYMQVLLQVLIILSGNYNFFNLLTITLCLSLLDDQHVLHLLRKPETPRERVLASSALGWLCVVVEVCVYILLAYGTVTYFDLKVDWKAKAVTSKTAFTYHKFLGFLRAVAKLGVWGGALSLLWEIVTAMFRCACVRGVFRMFWRTLQWWVFAAASVTMFGISLVPYTYMVYQGKSNLWPGVHRVFELTDRYQLVNSYGLFRRMTGVGGRPEVVIEGSMDRQTWTEIEFTYKPGNVSAAPPVVAPHQPRLDWQMWFAALGTHSQSPWFSRLMLRLLQGKRDVIKLIQVDEDQYPFRDQAPAYLRAHRYKYWFTDINDERRDQQKWWRRVYVEEFYPIVHLGDSFLENMLSQHGLKDKAVVRRGPEALLPWLLRVVGERVRAFSAPLVLCWMFSAAVSVCVLNTLTSHTHTPVEGEGEEGKVNKRARKEERHREVNESTREEERDGPEEGRDGPEEERGRLEEERDGLEEEREGTEEEREGTEEEGEGTEEEGEGTEEERDGMENKEEEEPHSDWLRKRK